MKTFLKAGLYGILAAVMISGLADILFGFSFWPGAFIAAPFAGFAFFLTLNRVKPETE